MKKQTNPVANLVNVVLIGGVILGVLLTFVFRSADSKTPMDRHIEYILSEHNEHCQYEMGECPQFECSHYGKTN